MSQGTEGSWIWWSQATSAPMVANFYTEGHQTVLDTLVGMIILHRQTCTAELVVLVVEA